MLALLTVSSAAVGQSVPVYNIPKLDPVAFKVANMATKPVIEHIQSGAQCPTLLGQMQLAVTSNLRPGDGTNVGCQYDKTDESGLTRVTMYIYTYPGINGAREYQGAKAQIMQRGDASALKVEELSAVGQVCFDALIPHVGKAAMARNTVDELEQETNPVSFGTATYNFDVPAGNGQPALKQTSLLSVYQAGKWVVKTRVTLPGQGKEVAFRACELSGIATVNQVPLISRKTEA
ncbi:hypothetical protein [Altererythrobacter sp. ZODW24]|uniref:hypothetical protein n=1 Tax=Altererythrobacter sp. ZODW24 TaxID=2185142 RepID=UPI0013B449C6|nr:hypothetical protein [Altererythrobacter sp. ZODW24]